MPAAPPDRLVLTSLALCAGVAVLMQAPLSDWFIEDAAISFAYARNLATGHGWVPFVGAEPVEGFSNPLWTGWLALCYPLLDPFRAAKMSAAVLSAITVWATWGIARRALPAHATVTSLLAALLVATHPQLAIWSASGLEVSLYVALGALGVWRLTEERPSDGVPWSAVAIGALAVTRPEGALTVVVLATVRLIARPTPWRRAALWIAVAVAPGVAYEAFRLVTFAWPLPNTYYAKLGDHHAALLDPTGAGWRYVIAYAQTSWLAWLVPIPLAALLGVGRRWGLWALLSGAVVIALVTADPARTAPPDPWGVARTVTLLAAPTLALLAGIGRPHWRPRTACAAMIGAGLLFAVVSGGDWMRGYRWLSLVAPALAVLFAAGVHDLTCALAAPFRAHRARVVVPLGLAAVTVWVTPALDQVVAFTANPVTTPQDILQRVRYNDLLQRLLELDHAENLEVDMGGSLWWGDDTFLDIAGLTDVPMAHHNNEAPFLRDYLFREHRPAFMHTHMAWRRRLGLDRIDAWSEGWVETPGYPLSHPDAAHGGCMVRKDLFVVDHWDGPADRAVTFDAGVSLLGWTTPSPRVGPDDTLTLRLAMRATPRTADGAFTLFAFLASPTATRVISVPPGQFFYPPSAWQDGEIVVTHAFLPLTDLPPGDYALGLFLSDRAGPLVPLVTQAAAPFVDPSAIPWVTDAEVSWPNAVTLGTADEGAAWLADDLTARHTLALSGDCDRAGTSWRDARARRSDDAAWLRKEVPRARADLAACWVVRAQTLSDRASVIAALSRARRLDPAAVGLSALAAPLAAARHREGLEARADHRWQDAYDAFTDAVTLETSRAWSRRYAEEARDHRLLIRAGRFDPR